MIPDRTEQNIVHFFGFEHNVHQWLLDLSYIMIPCSNARAKPAAKTGSNLFSLILFSIRLVQNRRQRKSAAHWLRPLFVVNENCQSNTANFID